jgi:hypothetical protein
MNRSHLAAALELEIDHRFGGTCDSSRENTEQYLELQRRGSSKTLTQATLIENERSWCLFASEPDPITDPPRYGLRHPVGSGA